MTNVFINNETGTPFSRAQLSEAFSLVSDAGDWKNPVDACVTPFCASERNVRLADLLRMIEEAVIFYTGSVPTIENDGGSYSVRAVGYYKAIGA